MEKAKLFQNGSSQAVRLPKAYRFDGDEVYVKRIGEAVVLLPMDGAWDTMAEALRMFSEDLVLERDEPLTDVRESL
ncbi:MULTISPECIES: type II toxin-antitoxin system antitoxin VapB [Alicyclobacillus]|uniref:SpoVT/AbrB domain protein n=1 Tax=Alicyclobacillus acidocaldarius subsp. acidocaldarius (strain ATCC 27009 / DSM 446 / BCRC 14685 / JCM 5260 / KCTC 1825 / NBRC 15652 / NCIMB 11725 / NRRL B-14509 / 104-IA) TaxID=521098 RepID=C8WSZ3_ALIAD|nr:MULTISPECIES: AbrB/MazE/SpoVT family DNA-binding domain-containing protein [Alicyclobacillus]ACV57649.1 SpoVT/AbrB domain protein [Alicyclobacillus acidocaldarius subsp. acidocaldarius DSM 446]